MRPWIVLAAGLLVAAPALAEAPRVQLGQLRVPGNSPSPSPSRPTGGLIENLTPGLALELSQAMGLTDARIEKNDDNTTSIYGTASGVSVELSMGECPDTCSASFPKFYAQFGKQDGVDANFANGFNADHDAILYVTADGSAVLSFPLYLEGGVSREHIVVVGKAFLGTIQAAIEYKPN